jgi:hypothetical protein
MDRPPKKETLEELVNEVVFARNNFPSNKHNLAALTEELGELAQAMIETSRGCTMDWRHEALQVACVALRVYEEGDSTFDLPLDS